MGERLRDSKWVYLVLAVAGFGAAFAIALFSQ
jgi:hypothetical protein